MDRLYTINLTRGAYVVKGHDAERILEAIASSDPHVLVEADLLGDGLYYSEVRVVIAHVMSVVRNAQVDDMQGGSRRLRLVTSDQTSFSTS